MLALLLGALALLALWAGLRAFEHASIASIKLLLAWIAALAGLTLTVLLVLTGRGAIAFLGLSFLFPLIRDRWQAARTARPAGGRESAGAPPPRARGGMSRAEAYAVLGLAPGASEAAIQDAYHRLILAAHPDRGGSDWLAARINQARDVLLGKSRL